MSKRVLCPGTPEVFAVGYGAMPLSTAGRPVDESESIRVLHAVLDAGVTLIDTSNAYGLDDADFGHNERLIAKALRQWPGDRDSVVVATKGGRTRPQGRWGIDGRPESLKAACERSLAALGVDRIDLYHLNIPDPDVPLEESVGALADLRREGKIRWVGLSNVTVEEIRRAQSIVEIVTVQNMLNPRFRQALETGVVDYCAQHGIGFLAYHSVGSGHRHHITGRDCVRRIAERHGVSPYAAVLAWVIAQGPTVVPIPGARSIAHVLDSVSAARVQLDPEEIARIDRASFDPPFLHRARDGLLRRFRRWFLGRTPNVTDRLYESPPRDKQPSSRAALGPRAPARARGQRGS